MHTLERTLTELFEADGGQVKSRLREVDGYQTHYLEAGEDSAEPLVLVHGGNSEIGAGAERWHPCIGPLSKTFHVFAVDRLGSGGTGIPQDPAIMSHARVGAHHVIAFIESLNVGPVHIVGQSQGGWIATYITLRRPDLVKKLVIVDSGTTTGTETGKTATLPYRNRLYQEGTMVSKIDLTTGDGIREFISEFVYNPAALTPLHVNHLVALSAKWHPIYLRHREEHRRGGEADAERMKEMHEVDGVHISEHVQNISRPTLVLWGRQSNKSLEGVMELYLKIPDADLHIMDKANHFLWLDQPAAFNSLITWYLTGMGK